MNLEEWRLRMGFDASEVKAGTAAMLDGQKKASLQYVSFWESALEKKDVSERASMDASFARYQANTEKKMLADKAWIAAYAARMKEKAAIDAIGAGSGAFGSMESAAAASVGGVGGAGGGKGDGMGRSKTIMLREARVLVHEISQGRYRNAIGSLMILLEATGGKMRALINGLFGFTGLAIGAFVLAGVAIYHRIKELNSLTTEMEKSNAESIGNRKKAMKDATDEGIKGAAQLKAHILSLAEAHETLSDWAERAAKNVLKAAAAHEKILQSQGNARIAFVNMAEHLGMMSGADASAQRSGLTAGMFAAIQRSQFHAIKAEGAYLNSAFGAATAAQPGLQSAAAAAESASKGTDANGNITNREAYNRNVALKTRTNLEAQLAEGQARVEQLSHIRDQTPGQVLANLADPAFKSKLALLEGQERTNTGYKALLKQSEDQNKKNIAAQVMAEEAYKRAVKNLDENDTSMKKLKVDLDNYTEKLGDFGTGKGALSADLRTEIYKNKQAMGDVEKEYPTIENMAGRAWTARLNARYGKGGIYDLGLGDGAHSNASRDYLLAQKQQIYDRTYGNNAAAEQDRLNMVTARTILENEGAVTPVMQMQHLIEQNGILVSELTALGRIASTTGIKLSETPGSN